MKHSFTPVRVPLKTFDTSNNLQGLDVTIEQYIRSDLPRDQYCEMSELTLAQDPGSGDLYLFISYGWMYNIRFFDAQDANVGAINEEFGLIVSHNGCFITTSPVAAHTKEEIVEGVPHVIFDNSRCIFQLDEPTSFEDWKKMLK